MCDYLAYCLDDPETSSVILFVEGFKRPERFLALADRALELGKPIMAVKVGRSDQAQAAAMAHSGSLAGETRVTDAALDAAGVIRCRDLDELLETAELVEGVRRTGRRVGRGRTGVVTVSTGEASLIADLVPRTGLDLPPDARLRASRHPRGAADDGLHRQPARPVGRGRPRHRVRRRVRGDGRVGRLRRAGPGPRLPVPLAAVRGRHGQRGDRRAPGGDGRASRHPAGLRVADVRRAAARDQGAARRGRSRGTAPARRRPGLPGDRRGRPLGATPRASPATTGHGGPDWPGLAASRTSYGADPAPDAAACPATGGAVRAREPGLRVGRRDPGDRGHGRDRRADRGRRGAPDRATGRAQARRRRARPQERGRRARARAARRRRGLRRRPDAARDRAGGTT